MRRPAPLNVGRVAYANAYPVFRGLLRDPSRAGVRLFTGPPSALNRLMERGALDVAPVSAAAYLRHTHDWLLLPGLSISAWGNVRSVLVCEAGAAAKGNRLLVPRDSETAVLVARLLTQWRGEGDPRIVRYRGKPPSGRFLSIGDAALRIFDAQPRGVKIAYDVAAEWRRFTGTPCVFAVFAVRREVFLRDRTGVERLAATLRAGAAKSAAHRSAVAREASALFGFSPARLLDYFRGLRYQLGESEIAGLATMWIEGHAAGFLPEVSTMRFASDTR